MKQLNLMQFARWSSLDRITIYRMIKSGRLSTELVNEPRRYIPLTKENKAEVRKAQKHSKLSRKKIK